MMTTGIDLARKPDRTAWAVRAAGETNWQFHYDAEEFERAHGFSPLVRLVSRAELEAFELRTPAHEERVVAALQDRLRAHADRQGPCVTADQAISIEFRLRAYFATVKRWGPLSWKEAAPGHCS